MKENINEHDMTKKMMDIMRGGFKKILKENEANEYDRDYVIDIRPGTAEYSKQLEELKTVDASAKIIDFKIYPNEENVKLSGVYKENSTVNSGVHFNFMLNDEEPKITMQDVNLDSEFMNKLQGFFEVWKDEWLTELPKSYKPKSNDQS
jgi:hypothetical protein